MRINVLHEGDKVINVTNDFIAVERISGEVDIIPLIRDGNGLWINTKEILTIGYGENTVQTETDNGISITNF